MRLPINIAIDSLNKLNELELSTYIPEYPIFVYWVEKIKLLISSELKYINELFDTPPLYDEYVGKKNIILSRNGLTEEDDLSSVDELIELDKEYDDIIKGKTSLDGSIELLTTFSELHQDLPVIHEVYIPDTLRLCDILPKHAFNYLVEGLDIEGNHL